MEPGCDLAVHARGLCNAHYRRGLRESRFLVATQPPLESAAITLQDGQTPAEIAENVGIVDEILRLVPESAGPRWALALSLGRAVEAAEAAGDVRGAAAAGRVLWPLLQALTVPTRAVGEVSTDEEQAVVHHLRVTSLGDPA